MSSDNHAGWASLSMALFFIYRNSIFFSFHTWDHLRFNLFRNPFPGLHTLLQWTLIMTTTNTNYLWASLSSCFLDVVMSCSIQYSSSRRKVRYLFQKTVFRRHQGKNNNFQSKGAKSQTRDTAAKCLFEKFERTYLPWHKEVDDAIIIACKVATYVASLILNV